EIAALVGEAVLEAVGTIGVPTALEDAVVDERPETVGEKRAGRPRAQLEVLEAPRAHERLPEDEQRPAVADHREGARDRAVLLRDAAPAHVRNITRCVRNQNSLSSRCERTRAVSRAGRQTGRARRRRPAPAVFRTSFRPDRVPAVLHPVPGATP